MDRPTLASILEQSKKLSSSLQDPYAASTSGPASGSGTAAIYGLPSIDLGLEQIEQQSRRLAARSAYSQQQASNLFNSANGAYGTAGLDAGNREDEAARAQYLLAQAQVDTSSLDRTLASLQPQNAFAPLQAHADNDISFLARQAHQSILVDCVEQGRQETMRDFYIALREDMFRDWEKQKQSIFEDLGRHHPTLLSNSDMAVDPSSSTNNPSPGRKPRKSTGYSNSTAYLNQAASLGSGSELALHTKMMKYDSVVGKLNTSRKESSSSLGIVTLLSDAIAPTTSSFTMGQTSDRALPLVETYNLLKYILGEKNCVGQQGEFVKDEKKMGQYAAAYAFDAVEGKEAIAFRMQVARGSKSYLEDQFMKHVEATLIKNPQQANLGGVPSNTNKLRAYVSITYATQNGGWNPILEIIGGQPVWARLFFLLRAGLKEDAITFASSKEMVTGINSTEPNFLSYFKDWSQNGRLSKSNRDRYQNEYNQKIRYLQPATTSNPLSSSSSSTSDPFKLALYKIIGRADLNKRNIAGVTDKTEHWLWLQLSLVHEELETATSAAVNNTGRSDRYGLRDLANVLRKFGEAHWDPKRDRPGLYFQVLLMSGQFERAVAFLYSRQAHRTDAVHFAVALAYYGLIRVPELSKTSEMDYLTTDTDVQGYEVCRLNFARYLHRYYWAFVKADPTHALQYIALISLGTPDGASTTAIREEQKSVVADYVKELLVQSKAYAALLGELDTEGKKMPGTIPQNAKLFGVEDSKSWIKSIVASVVTSADSNVSFSDIILLYNIAENYDSVIGTLNSELGTSLSQVNQPNMQINGSTAQQDVLATAKSVLEHYEQNGVRLNRSARETLQKLIRLKDAFGMYEAGRLDDALVTFETVQLIPMQSEGDVVPIIKAAEEFKSLDEAIVRNFDAILLMAMNILFSIHQRLKESPYGDVSRQNRMSEMKTKARALMMFAGMLRYKLSAQTYHQLSRQEVYLH